MHGDFSLNPLAYRDNVSRVLYQMGRVQLDSDANEQTEATLRFLRGLGEDIIGPAGGPGTSFEIKAGPKRLFTVGWGVYYVDGIRCVHAPYRDRWEFALAPPQDPPEVINLQNSFWDEDEEVPKEEQLLYLAVWERHVSASEDDRLREVALQGPDTASRSVVVWQIRATPSQPVLEVEKKLAVRPFPLYQALNIVLRSGARMRARARSKQTTDPCIIAPEAQYRGAENRLYRVEIHDGGDDDPKTKARPTFKWSPDNGAIVYSVREIEGATVFLDSLGRDYRTTLNIGDWVEVVDDRTTLTRTVAPLRKVVSVDPHGVSVTLDGEPGLTEEKRRRPIRPILRRWSSAPIPLRSGKDEDDGWYELSDGVEVRFATRPNPHARFRSGDYWLVPTRTATGDVIWPDDPMTKLPADLSPHGINEHYAPLATWSDAGIVDRRSTFKQLTAP